MGESGKPGPFGIKSGSGPAAQVIVDRNMRLSQVLVHDVVVVRGSGPGRAASESAS